MIEKSKNPAKVFDVAKPGKTAPSASSKPIIITNRPVLQDPMMAQDNSVDPANPKPASASPAKPSTRIAINPIHIDDEQPKPKESASNQEPQPPAAKTSVGETVIQPLSAETTTASTDQSAEALDADSAPAEESAPAKSEETSADQSTTDTTPNQVEASVATDSEDDSSTEDTTKSANMVKADADAARKQAARTVELDKLAESHKYYLPINQVEKRKNKRYALVGALLIVLLGTAWTDISLDAGIITLGSLKAPTHFFSATAAPAARLATPAAQPVSLTKTYVSSTGDVSITYPKTWTITTPPNFPVELKYFLAPDDAKGGQKGEFAVTFIRNTKGANGQTTYPSSKTTKPAYTVADVSYQKLPNSPTDVPLYLQQFTIEDQSLSATAPRYRVYMNVTSDTTLQVGNHVTGANDVITNLPFGLKNDPDTLLLYGSFAANGLDGQEGFQTLQQAQDFAKNNTAFKQASAILLSLKAI